MDGFRGCRIPKGWGRPNISSQRKDASRSSFDPVWLVLVASLSLSREEVVSLGATSGVFGYQEACCGPTNRQIKGPR